MKLNITQKISGLLTAAICGAIITAMFSYSYSVQTAGDVSAVNIAGRQRMLSRVLHEYAVMIHNGQDEDRKDLRKFVAEFDEALAALELGGAVQGRMLSPAPSEVLDEILTAKHLWHKAKIALLTIADRPADDPESAEAFRFVNSSTDQLTEVSDLVVSALELRAEKLRSKTLLVIVLTIIFDFAFLVGGVWTLKRYINDRHRTTKLLRLTQFSVDNAGEAVLRIRPDGRIAYVNASACQIAGRTPGELLTMSLWDVDSNLRREAWPELWQEMKRRGTITMELEFCRSDGQAYMIELRANHLQHDGSEYAVGFVRDITERKRAEEALQKSEEAYRLIVDNTDTGFVVVDDAGTVVDANEPYVRLAGAVQMDDIIGHSVIEWTAPECREANQEAVALCAKQGYMKDFETTYLHDDGTRVIILINAAMHETSEGVRLSAHCRDITERRMAEEKVVHWAAFARNNPAPVLKLDLDGRIVLMNPAARNLVGRDVTDEFIMSVFSSAADLFSKPTPNNVSTNVEQKWKAETYLFSFQRDESTDSIYVFGSNITETKRLQELESRAARLETAGTIAGQVAHDFNNLLAPIVAYPEFIRDELPPDHKAQVYLEAIEKAAKKIAIINQDLLTMGRRGHYNQEVIDLNTVALQAAREMESRTKTVTCEMDLCEDLMNIRGGAAQIHRVLTNLLVNAQDAMQDTGKITVKTENYSADDTSIAFGRVPKGEYVKLTVSDNGCGIPDNIIQKILDPFFSTKTADHKRGSGLGLSVVDAVMKDHNGYLDLSSRIGHGTSFFLYFPSTRENTGEDESERPTGGTETILVVDDDNVQRKVTSQLLTKLGYEVSSVQSGEKAIEFLRENPLDILILDMVMPGGIDGAEAYRRILAINPHQNAIILSGFSESDRVLETQKLGAGAFVRKPVTKGVIATAVRAELDRHAEGVSDDTGDKVEATELSAPLMSPAPPT